MTMAKEQIFASFEKMQPEFDTFFMRQLVAHGPEVVAVFTIWFAAQIAIGAEIPREKFVKTAGGQYDSALLTMKRMFGEDVSDA